MEPEPSGLTSDLLGPALSVVAELVRRLAAVLDEPPPFNAWLHDGEHWHLEVMPRTTRLGGLELGGGVWVNSVPPEDAAARLRG
jgi:UDPglucose--hexose-1-phosphate uridylyltransferase